MTRTTELSAELPAAACGVASHAFVQARLSEIPRWRDQPGPDGAPALPPRFLRHCDEHTVVGIHAVLAAIAAHPAPRPAFCDHGVVAATCQAGRLQGAATLVLLRAQGPRHVSPHLVPQCSLHSLAGAVSVGLGMHGPNVGIGGGPDALAEGLIAAVSLVQPGGGADAAGTWLIVTEWDAEPAIDPSGVPHGDPLCRGLALALEPHADAGLVLSFHSRPDDGRAVGTADGSATDQLGSFARALAMCATGGALVSWTVDGPGATEIRLARAARPTVRHHVRREAA